MNYLSERLRETQHLLNFSWESLKAADFILHSSATTAAVVYLTLCGGTKATCDYFNTTDLPPALAESFILLWHLPQGRLWNANPSPAQRASSQRFYIPHQFAICRRKKQGALKQGDLHWISSDQDFEIVNVERLLPYCSVRPSRQRCSGTAQQPAGFSFRQSSPSLRCLHQQTLPMVQAASIPDGAGSPALHKFLGTSDHCKDRRGALQMVCARGGHCLDGRRAAD